MSLNELYQNVILEHNRSPRNYREMEDANRKAEGNNPLCGDRLTVWVRLDDDDLIQDASFQGSGCAISKASASLMTNAVKGRTRQEAEELFRRFNRLVTGTSIRRRRNPGQARRVLGVSEFPVRIKCASLSWHALRAALAARATSSPPNNP
jgi:nitrogen fixation NifU-like protein